MCVVPGMSLSSASIQKGKNAQNVQWCVCGVKAVQVAGSVQVVYEEQQRMRGSLFQVQVCVCSVVCVWQGRQWRW